MTKTKSAQYQDGKIKYHDKMVGYYEDMKKGSIVSRLTDEEIDEQIGYHARLGAYHKKRRILILRGS